MCSHQRRSPPNYKDLSENQNMPPQYNYWDYPPPSYLQPLETKNVGSTTLTLQQFGGIVVVLGSIILSGFSTWNNLNRDLDQQKTSAEQFKIQINKDIDGISSDVKDLKNLQELIKNDNKQLADSLNKRITELDASVTQLYQKVNGK